MAVASVNTPIKDTMGATFSAGFDITAKTAIDGRMSVKLTTDLTDKRAWASKSGSATVPEYWMYNGMVTSVAETGKLYVLTGIDESLPRTVWPEPAAPGVVATGPRWIEVGGADNFLRSANIVDAKYGYTESGQTQATYYEAGAPYYDKVYEDSELTILATQKKYLKLVVSQSDNTGIITNTIYCDVQELIKNIGKAISIYGQDVLAASFDGTTDRNLNLTGSENIELTVIPNQSINFGLVWRTIAGCLGKVTLIHKLEGFAVSNLTQARSMWGAESRYGDNFLQFSKSWNFEDTYSYAFGAVYDQSGNPSELGELDPSLLVIPSNKKFIGWTCTCSTMDSEHEDVVIYENGVINTTAIEHLLEPSENEYTLTLTLKYESI